jgi:hypothetical protein
MGIFSFAILPEQREKLVEIAKKNHRSASAQIRLFIDQGIRLLEEGESNSNKQDKISADRTANRCGATPTTTVTGDRGA